MKIKEIWQKHKKKIIMGGSLIVGAGVLAWLVQRGYKPIKVSGELSVIDPEYFDKFEDAVDAFKKLEENCDHPVLNNWIENGKNCYGVFDETSIVT